MTLLFLLILTACLGMAQDVPSYAFVVMKSGSVKVVNLGPGLYLEAPGTGQSRPTLKAPTCTSNPPVNCPPGISGALTVLTVDCETTPITFDIAPWIWKKASGQ